MGTSLTLERSMLFQIIVSTAHSALLSKLVTENDAGKTSSFKKKSAISERALQILKIAESV